MFTSKFRTIIIILPQERKESMKEKAGKKGRRPERQVKFLINSLKHVTGNTT